MQFPVLAECQVAPDAVHRDADDLRVKLRKLRLKLVIQTKLIAANRTPVSRIKNEHHRVSAKL